LELERRKMKRWDWAMFGVWILHAVLAVLMGRAGHTVAALSAAYYLVLWKQETIK